MSKGKVSHTATMQTICET